MTTTTFSFILWTALVTIILMGAAQEIQPTRFVKAVVAVAVLSIPAMIATWLWKERLFP
jgi:hypothetical protein